MANKFRSDGSFLSQFLAADDGSAGGERREAWQLPDPVRFGETEPAVRQSTGRKRKFSETAPSNSDKPKKSKWDDAAVGGHGARPDSQKRAEEAAERSAADEQYDALKHLKPNELLPEKDTYEQCLDSGGAIEGGTWEHRKRAKEMIKTANLAAAITEVSRTAKLSHRGAGIGGYLPMEIAAALEDKLEGDAASSNSGKSLDSSNRGYQLLKQAGWEEGKGLGAGGVGITTPIEAVEKKALGQGSAEDDGGSKDPFEQYRKRMMLAYRFRPNPLNNPRRSYDGYDTLYDNSKMNSTLQKIHDVQQAKKS